MYKHWVYIDSDKLKNKISFIYYYKLYQSLLPKFFDGLVFHPVFIVCFLLLFLLLVLALSITRIGFGSTITLTSY